MQATSSWASDLARGASGLSRRAKHACCIPLLLLVACGAASQRPATFPTAILSPTDQTVPKDAWAYIFRFNWWLKPPAGWNQTRVRSRDPNTHNVLTLTSNNPVGDPEMPAALQISVTKRDTPAILANLCREAAQRASSGKLQSEEARTLLNTSIRVCTISYRSRDRDVIASVMFAVRDDTVLQVLYGSTVSSLSRLNELLASIRPAEPNKSADSLRALWRLTTGSVKAFLWLISPKNR